MWKLIRRIHYSEIEEAKVKLSTPSCKQCGKEDVDRVYLYFQCDKFLNLGTTFFENFESIWPPISLWRGVGIQSDGGTPSVVLVHSMYFVLYWQKQTKNRAFLWTEFETLKLSKYADEEMLCAIHIILELVDEEYMIWDFVSVAWRDGSRRYDSLHGN